MRFHMNAKRKIVALFSFKGQVSRSGFLLGLVKVVFMYIIICLLLLPITVVLELVVFKDSHLADSNFLDYLGPVLGVFLCCWAGLALSVRRCHDISHSGWYVLFYFIPQVNLIFTFVLFLTPSSDEVHPIKTNSGDYL